MKKILVLHGPNLNLLGTRQPEHYGNSTLAEINTSLIDCDQANVECKQSNSESELIDWVHQAAQDKVDFIIINPAAFTHSSIALRDALEAVNIPFIEVHLSAIKEREPFRHHSYFSDIATEVIDGLGPQGYIHALQAATHYLKTQSE